MYRSFQATYVLASIPIDASVFKKSTLQGIAHTLRLHCYSPLHTLCLRTHIRHKHLDAPRHVRLEDVGPCSQVVYPGVPEDILVS